MRATFIDGTPTVTLQLDQPREIAFTLGTLRRVKERAGTLDFDANDPALLAVYIWACLPAQGRSELSPEEIEDMIHPGNMEAVMEQVTALLQRSTPDAKANPTAAAPAAS